MTITLVGSSRELRNRRVLPPIDLLNLIAGERPTAAIPPGASVPADHGVGSCDVQGDSSKHASNGFGGLPRKTVSGVSNGGGSGGSGGPQSPRSLATGDGFAEDLDPVVTLLRSRQHPTLNGKVTPAPVAPDASRKDFSKPEDASTGAAGRGEMGLLLPHPHHRATSRIESLSSGTAWEMAAPSNRLRETSARGGGTKQTSAPHDTPKGEGSRLRIDGWDSGGGGGDGAFARAGSPHTARVIAQRRPEPPLLFARGTSAGGDSARRRRKSRVNSGGFLVPSTSEHLDDTMLRLCPALEARISDLRRDNVAAARFLSKTQAAAWQKARRTEGLLVARNRVVCALEGAEVSFLRREELAMRMQRRREANRERKQLLERRRVKKAEAMRMKHEGPTLAERQAHEQAALLEKRQHFLLVAVVSVNSVVRWRNEWKERRWKLAGLAEALAGHGQDMGTLEASAVRVQRFIRRQLGRNRHGGQSSNAIRCLKQWIPKAHARWNNRRRQGAQVMYDFLMDAKLSLYNTAIYRFRRKVIWCQMYVKGLHLITRDRLVLLGLFFSRCEVRLKARLAGRVRQQVHDEAAADLEVHRQLMRPPAAGAAGDASNTAVGGRRGGQKVSNGGNGSVGVSGVGGGDDDASGLMETVMALRLKLALEELEARSASPEVKNELLQDLLVQVRAAHQAGLRLSSRGEEAAKGGGGCGKGGKDNRRRVSLPQALFTVDDARELVTRSPPPPPFPDLDGVKDRPTTGSGREREHHAVPGHGRGGDPTLPAAQTPVPLGKSASGSSCRTNTRVPPMLLLRDVAEAAMCQLVLAGWEKSSSSAGGGSGDKGSGIISKGNDVLNV